VDAQIVLGQIAAPVQHLAQLNQVARRGAEAGIQCQPVAGFALQLKTDPVGLRAMLGPQDDRLALKVLHRGLHSSVVEEVAHGHATAHLRRVLSAGPTHRLMFRNVPSC
jgi:hypothetical protein